MEPFRPRTVRYHLAHALEGWRLKLYSIVAGGVLPDWVRFEPGLRLALGALPMPAVAEGRPGLGFLIAHQGRTADSIATCWWSEENELATRVFRREHGTGLAWRAARDGESFCVWDLEVMAHERDAWIATMLTGNGGGDDGYLAKHAGVLADTVVLPAPIRPEPPTGAIAWSDLTVPDATGLRDFYAAVTGWEPKAVAMDGYDDYTMVEASTGRAVAGVCNARGPNADLPPQWLMYVTVSSLERSVERCRALGGALVAGPKEMGDYGRYAVIRDPAGAVMALIEPRREE